mmetsp:Transcript_24103/g.75550  ORF Transcript_24103/g.75550 Transcript_24103/m.75550 type:complete len:516 (-) Transcript_24103:3281-4828(-)
MIPSTKTLGSIPRRRRPRILRLRPSTARRRRVPSSPRRSSLSLRLPRPRPPPRRGASTRRRRRRRRPRRRRRTSRPRAPSSSPPWRRSWPSAHPDSWAGSTPSERWTAKTSMHALTHRASLAPNARTCPRPPSGTRAAPARTGTKLSIRMRTAARASTWTSATPRPTGGRSAGQTQLAAAIPTPPIVPTSLGRTSAARARPRTAAIRTLERAGRAASPSAGARSRPSPMGAATPSRTALTWPRGSRHAHRAPGAMKRGTAPEGTRELAAPSAWTSTFVRWTRAGPGTRLLPSLRWSARTSRAFPAARAAPAPRELCLTSQIPTSASTSMDARPARAGKERSLPPRARCLSRSGARTCRPAAGRRARPSPCAARRPSLPSRSSRAGHAPRGTAGMASTARRPPCARSSPTPAGTRARRTRPSRPASSGYHARTSPPGSEPASSAAPAPTASRGTARPARTSTSARATPARPRLWVGAPTRPGDSRAAPARTASSGAAIGPRTPSETSSTTWSPAAP